ncbi:MAG: pilus assembly protein [Acetobacteraceae bacterium]|nr:pilus assembly protein [Acetobacteraceae bacterium]
MITKRKFGCWPALTATRVWEGCNLLCHSQRGTTTLELAFVFPVLLAMIFGAEEIARLLWTRSTLQYAVALAARCAAINNTTCGSSSQIATYASSQVLGITVPASDFTPSSPSCGQQVTAKYQFSSLFPQLVPLNVNLTVSSCYL